MSLPSEARSRMARRIVSGGVSGRNKPPRVSVQVQPSCRHPSGPWAKKTCPHPHRVMPPIPPMLLARPRVPHRPEGEGRSVTLDQSIRQARSFHSNRLSGPSIGADLVPLEAPRHRLSDTVTSWMAPSSYLKKRA